MNYNNTHKQSYQTQVYKKWDSEALNKLLDWSPFDDSSTFVKNAKYYLTQTFNSLDTLLKGGMIFTMPKQEGL